MPAYPAMLTRGAWRRLSMGLPTIFGMRPQGFFLPYRYAASVAPIGYPGIELLLAEAEPRLKTVLSDIRDLALDILALPAKRQAPRFDQEWFPQLDAMAAYALVRRWRPKRIIEVGSGHSTRFLAAAIEDEALTTSLLCVDPAPRASLRHLQVTWQESIVQEVPAKDFDGLEAGDILFVDSSHLAMPGTDVDYIIGHVLPVLRPGVMVHVHDIFLPDPYPSSWRWRGYNEQTTIAALLQGGNYQLVFASRYAATRMAEHLDGPPFNDMSRHGSGLESSLWLQKT
ncbi:MAG: class I SAM-dependent methyltransferase [Geminicoccaceae bacterium]